MWTEECEKEFGESKKFLSSQPILVRPKVKPPFILYLAVSEKAISSVLVHDSEGDERAIYFVSKVLKGEEMCYQKIERPTLAEVYIARKLGHYF